MIRLRTKHTNPSAMSDPLYATGQQVEEILVGEVEEHAAGPDRYCRYLHIVTEDGELVMELWAATEAALELKNLAEEA